MHEGLAALKQRFLSRVPAKKQRVAAAKGPLPIPKVRLPFFEDPETLANVAGGFRIKPVAPSAVAMAGGPTPAVRMVGPAYYADLFDLTKLRQKAEQEQALRPSFGLVGPAAAAEPEPGSAIPPD